MPSTDVREIVKYRFPCFTTSAPVQCWRINARGDKSEPFMLPAGGQILNLTPDSIRRLSATYGHGGFTSASVIMPDGSILAAFVDKTQAEKALPPDADWGWDVPSQTYTWPAGMDCSPLSAALNRAGLMPAT